MTKPPSWFRSMMATLSAVAPWLAAALAWRLFWRLGKPAPVRDADRATHEQADLDRIDVRGASVVTYRWGDPARPAVILSHGWRSRGSRFSAITQALVAEGYCVRAFDAPGNGDSSGRRTVIYDYATAIRTLAAEHDQIAGVLGHSFGAVASAIALRRGVRSPLLITVSGVHSFDFIVQQFIDLIGLGTSAAQQFRTRVDRLGEVDDLAAVIEGDLWNDIVTRIDDKTVRMLVIHDDTDLSVPLSQAEAIAAMHRGPLETMTTHGLGHSALLADPAVVERVVGAVAISNQMSTDEHERNREG